MQGEQVYKESYQTYLQEHGYAGELSTQEINIDLSGFTASQEDIAAMGEEGLLTEDHGTVSWKFQVKEAGSP